ncbi:5080_t:CDS:2 [Funneliformis geosporum]|uniref:16970_t:CDS:1 n=1 Tax=Funneliformis geosporum TaxID=1117311 RepID=A0A9W4T1I0_9GLOM|nr:5080_t:CDS:2 [Funneliformis geosporum]CAI2189053.1 16970_t:CDS:2 [Funneliformis geosporum]
MSPETPQNDAADELSIQIQSPIMNALREAQTEYPEDNEDHDETSRLLSTNENSQKQQQDKTTSSINKRGKIFFKSRTFIKLVLLTIFIVIIVILLVVFKVQDHIKDYLELIEKHKKYGILIYLAIYTICIWLFLPGSLISIAAGFLFKPSILAGAIIIIGDIFGAFGTFIFGRYVFSDWVKAQIKKKPMFTALDSVITDEGWKIVVMLRLTPIPFNLISYFFSVSSIDLFPFLWATALGVLPGTFNAVWIGSLVKSLSRIDKPKLENKDIVIITMNFIFVACCVIVLSILGKRSLRKAMIKLQASKMTETDFNHDHRSSIGSSSSPQMTDVAVEEESPINSQAGGFTHAERIILCLIGVVSFLNIGISVPLYFYFRSIEENNSV